MNNRILNIEYRMLNIALRKKLRSFSLHSTFNIPHSTKGFTPHLFLRAKKGEGFTLVELLLYISIASIMLLTTTLFLQTLLESRVKNQTISEVQAQGAQVMHIITQTIRNAEAITSPAQGASASSLTLDVVDVGDDPTVFDLSSGVLRITEGAGSAIAITNSRVLVSGLSFENLSRTDTPGTLRVEFTITHTNSEGRNEYNFSKTFYGSASLR